VLDPIIRVLAAIGAVLQRIEIAIISVIAGLLVLSTGWGVFSRYALNRPLPWPEEVGVFLYIWMSYLGAAAVLRQRRHIAIGFFVDSMSPRWRSLVTIFTHALMLGFFAIVITYAWRVMPAQLTIEIGAAVRLPRAYLTLSLFLASISMLLTSLQIILEEIRGLMRGDGGTGAPAPFEV
jgi:TRAP-type C4-dicarboxylate transport system permease small subunit